MILSKLTKTTATCASVLALSGASAWSDIKINDTLTLNGFMDMSYTSVSNDKAADVDTMQIDQFEVDFLFDLTQGLTGRADIEGGNDTRAGIDGGAVSLEQAYLNYGFGNGVNVTAGRFLSYSGWETEEPTGLYQKSGALGGAFYGAYQNGVSLGYGGKKFGLAASIVDEVWGDGDGSANDLGYELKVEIMPTEAITAKLIYMSEDITPVGLASYTQSVLNFWVSYAIKKLTLAAEYNDGSDFGGKSEDRSGYLLMANYRFTERVDATLRYHAWEHENALGATTIDTNAITISPSVEILESWTLIFEARFDTDDTVAAADSSTFAVESLWTF